jgi:hypothetical protein
VLQLCIQQQQQQQQQQQLITTSYILLPARGKAIELTATVT